MLKRLNLQAIESVVMLLINMAVQGILLTKLSAIEFSEYTLAILFINGGTAFLDLGLSDQIIRRKSYRKRYPISLVYIFYVYSLLIPSVLLIWIMASNVDASYSHNIFLLYLVLAQVLNNFSTYYMRSHLFIKELVCIRLIGSIGLLLYLFSIQFTSVLDVIIAIALFETIKLLLFIGYLGGIRRKKFFCRPKYLLNKEIFYKLYQSSYGYHSARVLTFGTRNLDLYLVSLFASLEEFASYAVVFRFSRPLVRLIAGSVNKILFPELMNLSDSKGAILLRKAQLFVFACSLIFFCLVGSSLRLIIDTFTDGAGYDVDRFIVPAMLVCVSLVQLGTIDAILKSYATQGDITKLSIMRLILTLVPFAWSLSFGLVVALYTLNIIILSLYVITYVFCVLKNEKIKIMAPGVIAIIGCTLLLMLLVQLY